MKRPKNKTIYVEDFVEQFSKKMGMTKVDSIKAINSIEDIIVSSLKDGNSVQFTNFGTFYLKNCSARIGRNPKTGEKVDIPERIVPAFNPGKKLYEEFCLTR